MEGDMASTLKCPACLREQDATNRQCEDWDCENARTMMFWRYQEQTRYVGFFGARYKCIELEASVRDDSRMIITPYVPARRTADEQATTVTTVEEPIPASKTAEEAEPTGQTVEGHRPVQMTGARRQSSSAASGTDAVAPALKQQPARAETDAIGLLELNHPTRAKAVRSASTQQKQLAREDTSTIEPLDPTRHTAPKAAVGHIDTQESKQIEQLQPQSRPSHLKIDTGSELQNVERATGTNTDPSTPVTSGAQSTQPRTLEGPNSSQAAPAERSTSQRTASPNKAASEDIPVATPEETWLTIEELIAQCPLPPLPPPVARPPATRMSWGLDPHPTPSKIVERMHRAHIEARWTENGMEYKTVWERHPPAHWIAGLHIKQGSTCFTVKWAKTAGAVCTKCTVRNPEHARGHTLAQCGKMVKEYSRIAHARLRGIRTIRISNDEQGWWNLSEGSVILYHKEKIHALQDALFKDQSPSAEDHRKWLADEMEDLEHVEIELRELQKDRNNILATIGDNWWARAFSIPQRPVSDDIPDHLKRVGLTKLVKKDQHDLSKTPAKWTNLWLRW